VRGSEETTEASDEEPTTLIDPVTGMLMVMRVKEGGKYVPVQPSAVPPISLGPRAETVAPPVLMSTASVAAPAPKSPLPAAPACIKTNPSPVNQCQSAASSEHLSPIVNEGLASHWIQAPDGKVCIIYSLPMYQPMYTMVCLFKHVLAYLQLTH